MKNILKKGVVVMGGMLLGLLLFASPVKAGFGITPAKIVNEILPRGVTINADVFLVRDKANEAWQITVNNQMKKMKTWIDIAEGNDTFIMPTGTTKMQLHIKLTVPADAPYDYYEGILSFEAVPARAVNPGEVKVAVGAGTIYKITVTDKEFYDFTYDFLQIPQLETGWPIKTIVTIDNTGNVQARPTKVHLDIFDYNDRNKMVQSGDIEEYTFVDPFTKGDSVGYLPSNLPPGKYLANYRVYKKTEVAASSMVLFEVLPRWSLTPKPWLIKLFEYLTASPTRVAISSVAGTLLILILISLILKAMRKRENKKQQ